MSTQLNSPAAIECDALLFDLDGVLVDSTACIERTWVTWAMRHGLDASVVVLAAHGRRALETVRRLAPQLDAVSEVAQLAALEATAVEGVFNVRGARALIDALPGNRWAVVTSALRPVAEHRLRLAHLPLPAVMICAEDVANGKPDAEGYLTAAYQLGIAPTHCVVVEDAPAGLSAARAAGMRAIAVTTTHSPDELGDSMAIAPALDAIRLEVMNRQGATRLHIRIRRDERS